MGAHWFFLEHRLGIPFHQILVSDLASLDLDEFDVLIAPGGRGLMGVLGDRGFEGSIRPRTGPSNPRPP